MTDALTVEQLEALIGAKVDRRSFPDWKPMQITAEFLAKELEGIRAQKRNASDVFQQATGAEMAILSLIERLAAAEPTPEPEKAE